MTNRRAIKLWKRLNQSYGARFAEQFGETPPDVWAEAVDSFTDEQIAFGLRKVIREHLQHPPSLGAFMQACNDMPVAPREDGPTLQAQLAEYTMLKLFGRLTAAQVREPWTFLYAEGLDPERPKGHQRTASCTGLVIPADGNGAGYRVNVMDMQADTELHNRAMRKLTSTDKLRAPPAGVFTGALPPQPSG